MRLRNQPRYFSCWDILERKPKGFICKPNDFAQPLSRGFCVTRSVGTARPFVHPLCPELLGRPNRDASKCFRFSVPCFRRGRKWRLQSRIGRRGRLEQTHPRLTSSGIFHSFVETSNPLCQQWATEAIFDTRPLRFGKPLCDEAPQRPDGPTARHRTSRIGGSNRLKSTIQSWNKKVLPLQSVPAHLRPGASPVPKGSG